MNEPQKNKPRRPVLRILLIWLVFFTVIIVAMVIASRVPNMHSSYSRLHQAGICAVGATLSLGLFFVAKFIWMFIRWTCRSRRNFGRMLVGVTIFATLIAIFYTEEDWRGKRAWENYKHELEANGAILDWDKYIPPPIPDDQNFYTASTNILLRFKKMEADAEGEAAGKCQWLRINYAPNSFPMLTTTKTNPLVVAEFVVIASGDTTPKLSNDDLTVGLDDPAAHQKIQGLVQSNIGQSTMGVAGFQFSEHQLNGLPPVQIRLLTDTRPTITDLENLLGPGEFTNIGPVHVAITVDKNIFQVQLTTSRITAAADYLKWSDQFVPAFDEIREALQRPCAMLPGDYSQPYLMPIPNFVTMRTVAQTLAQRAQCYLLLAQPEKALPELMLVRDMCRILERPPTGKPITLVESMINVAISGLYVTIINDGMRSHAWQEPQLKAIQGQLAKINLIPFVSESFREGQMHAISIGERSSFKKIMTGELFNYGQQHTFMERLRGESYYLMPQGWVYQNILTATELHEKFIDCLDPANQQVFPKKLDQTGSKTWAILDHNHSIFYLLADMAIPNYTKAFQNTAYNQTQANEAQIACALESYHLAHGEYPETLDTLVPQFIEKIPQDIIGGGPLHYRRIEDPPTQSSGAASGKFLLYSVGWNETDDGGVTAKDKSGNEDRTRGDWVWKN